MKSIKRNSQFLNRELIFILDGNYDHLTNVIYNLLDNALKYSKQNPVIEINLKSDEDAISLEVKDHGLGIAPEHQKRIFEKFYRVPTGDVANTKGYGLGLSYVHHIIDLHNGQIDVRSTLGEGSTFTVTLPREGK
ncbi:MAG: ATP-binding protein [Cyclobacteriaceae bacterium]